MSYEKPEDKWKREKQYQPPAPVPAGPPTAAAGDETRWNQENQGQARQANPGQVAPSPQNGPEAQWVREKQGQRPAPPPVPGPETQWAREKQGQPQNQPPAAPDARWLQEKQGQQLPPGYRPGQDQQWLREKQGQHPAGAPGGPNRPPAAPEEIAWHQAKGAAATPPARSRSGLYLLLGISALVLIIAIAVLVFLLLTQKSGQSTTTTPTILPTPAATTAAVTTATGVVQTTTPAVTSLPALTPGPAATTMTANDSARLVGLAEEAARNSRWEEVVQSLELLGETDQNFNRAKPLLVKAYFELGEQQLSQGSNTQESANRTLIYYRKANALDPGFEGLSRALQRAELYGQGLLQFDSEQFSQAVTTLKPLYDEKQLEREGVHYRNTGEILYTAYIKLGDSSFNLNSLADLTRAKARYGEALALDVNNKDQANAKLQQVDRAIKLLGPTPTPAK